jgi:hypothetical protein
MKKLLLAVGLVSVAILATLAPAPALAESCQARVESGSGAIQAKLVPCEFTVPAGKTAVNLSCQRDNPKSGWSSSAPCKVYSVTQNRDMVDGQGKPLTSLPSGTYRFVVGGEPGAIGTFKYTLQ